MTHLTQQLNTMYTYATQSVLSDFYRTFYGESALPHIESITDWQTLPLLTKSDLVATPWRQRCFIPYAEVDCVRCSSGTSGSKPLVCPRTRFTLEDLPFYRDTLGSQHVNAMMTFVHPLHLAEITLKEASLNIPVIGADITNLEGSARLAKSLKVDALMCSVFILAPLIPLLKKHGVDKQLRLIEFMGERIAPAEEAFAREELPHVQFQHGYSLIEIHGTCGDIIGPSLSENVARPTSNYYWEIVNESGNVLTKEGDEGEIVLTMLWTAHNANPLLRYKTGDRARIVVHDADPRACRYKILGRMELDHIKLPGGELIVEEVIRSITGLHSKLVNDFELHFTREMTPSGEKPRVTVNIPKETNASFSAAVVHELADTLSSRLRVSPTRTYADGVTDNLYLPLELVPVNTLERGGKKAVRFVRHDV